VLADHDSSEGSSCVGGNHKRLGWWGRVDPSNSVGDGVVLGSRHHRTNMAEDAASTVRGVGAKCCIDGCFKGSDLGCSGPVARAMLEMVWVTAAAMVENILVWSRGKYMGNQLF